MENTIVFQVFLCIISLLIFFIITRKSSRYDSKLKLPPSPNSLPIIGHLHKLGSHPHRSLRALSQKYGPLMLLRLGNVPTLVVSSADVAKEIVKNHDVVFSSRPQTTAAKVLLYGCRDVGFAKYGEYWRQVRKICVVELLSLKRVKEFQGTREQETAVLMEKIRVRASEGLAINLTEMLIASSNNVLSRCVLGRDFAGEEGSSRFGELGRRMLTMLMAFSFGDFFPQLSWLDNLTGLMGRLKKIFKEMDVFLDEVIKEHEAVLESGGGNGSKDFVDFLLEIKKNDSLDFKLTLDNIKAILLDMFIGGSDTTTSSLEWIMTDLMRNPMAMKKVQEEVRREVLNKSKIESDDINRMNYLKCCIKETLRIHPPVPFLIPRETTSAVEIKGFHIPEKTRVFINAYSIQRDPKVWDKAEEFSPERFLNSDVDFKGKDFDLIPFGFGRRGCPGMAFGVANIEFVIANLLYWSDWKLPNSMSPQEIDMDEIYGLSVHKKIPLSLVPIPFSP